MHPGQCPALQEPCQEGPELYPGVQEQYPEDREQCQERPEPQVPYPALRGRYPGHQAALPEAAAYPITAGRPARPTADRQAALQDHRGTIQGPRAAAVHHTAEALRAATEALHIIAAAPAAEAVHTAGRRRATTDLPDIQEGLAAAEAPYHAAAADNPPDGYHTAGSTHPHAWTAMPRRFYLPSKHYYI